MIKAKKIKDYQRLKTALRIHDDFLVKRLGEEWGELQRRARAEALIHHAKASSQVVVKALLALLLVAGTVTIAAVAPNMFAVFGRLSRRRIFFERKNIKKAHEYLRKKSFVASHKEAGHCRLELTDKGRSNALLAAFRGLSIKEQVQWDGMWRVVIFDIPDKKKWARDTLRRGLREMGFLQMQKSVFVSPYPCEEEVEFLTAMCDVAGHIRLILTNTIIHDHDIKKFFSLS